MKKFNYFIKVFWINYVVINFVDKKLFPTYWLLNKKDYNIVIAVKEYLLPVPSTTKKGTRRRYYQWKSTCLQRLSMERPLSLTVISKQDLKPSIISSTITTNIIARTYTLKMNIMLMVTSIILSTFVTMIIDSESLDVSLK